MRKGDLFPVVDRILHHERQRLGLPENINLSMSLSESIQTGHSLIRAMGEYTGEIRCPKRGEWFLSGAEVETYLVANDLTTKYPIARLVRVEEKVVLVREVKLTTPESIRQALAQNKSFNLMFSLNDPFYFKHAEVLAGQKVKVICREFGMQASYEGILQPKTLGITTVGTEDLMNECIYQIVCYPESK